MTWDLKGKIGKRSLLSLLLIVCDGKLHDRDMLKKKDMLEEQGELTFAGQCMKILL